MINSKKEAPSRREIVRSRQNNSSALFNRGQTISGIKKEQSAIDKNRKLIVRRRKISIFFAVICIVSVLLICVLLQLVAGIKVVVNGKENSISSTYAEYINKYYDANPVERLLSQLNKGNFTKYMQEKYPEIKSISSIKMNGITKYTFDIETRKPIASWNLNNKMSYVDSDGVAFSNNFYAKPKISISDDSGIKIDDGKVVASNSFLGFVGKIVSELKSLNLEVSKISIPPMSLRQVIVNIEGVDYPIKVSTASSAKGQAIDISKAIQYFKSHRLNPKYLDVRVEGMGYYK